MMLILSAMDYTKIIIFGKPILKKMAHIENVNNFYTY
jgi:hypothetical protein